VATCGAYFAVLHSNRVHLFLAEERITGWHKCRSDSGWKRPAATEAFEDSVMREGLANQGVSAGHVELLPSCPSKPRKTYETFLIELFLNRLLEQVGVAFDCATPPAPICHFA
jgi:hypothetical protein